MNSTATAPAAKKIKITINPKSRTDQAAIADIASYEVNSLSEKALASKKAYFIHSNGGRPYGVIVNGLRVEVYKDEGETGETYAYLGKISCDEVMVGHDAIEEEHGNTILLKQGDSYIYIGGGEPGITAFNKEQEIVDYQSPLGPNDVPYPYAVSEDYIYLMIENVRIPKADAIEYQDGSNKLWPYTAYYEGDVNATPMETIVWEDFEF